MRALITGPEGTPYYGGCFIFDVYFPGGCREERFVGKVGLGQLCIFIFDVCFPSGCRGNLLASALPPGCSHLQ